MTDAALVPVLEALLDLDQLVRAVASGRARGQVEPEVAGRPVRRVELRPVDLKAGAHLQVASFDQTQSITQNHAAASLANAVEELLAQPFGNWHVKTTSQTLQARLTKKGDWLVHASKPAAPAVADRSHDRDKQHLLAPDSPVLLALGISDSQGRIKPTRQAKYRQVEEFLRLLDAAISDALTKGHLRTPTTDDPLRVVDLGCGNAYLTFAAHAHLSKTLPVRMTGVDVKQQSADHNSAVAAGLGIDADFMVGTIEGAELAQRPDVVLALHACDTATDDALARALDWRASLVLAAPCCHHDLSAQLRDRPPPEPNRMLVRDGILRERLADTLTDALRAALLRREGYRVDVVEFVESAHTPRNTLIRAVRTGAASPTDDYEALVAEWGVRPRLGDLLAPRAT